MERAQRGRGAAGGEEKKREEERGERERDKKTGEGGDGSFSFPPLTRPLCLSSPLSPFLQYWRTWNLPVHKFLVRHVYNPARRHGRGGRQGAVLAVFVVSALLHEVAVTVPLHAAVWPPWRAYAFWGVMLQVPLVSLTERLGSAATTGSAGNFVFWLSFCGLGQPAALIAYFVQWARERGVEPLPRRAVG